MTEHRFIHPERGDTIVMPDWLTYSGELREGRMWCWQCAGWEPVPVAWRQVEASLKEEILTEWQALRRLPGRIIAPSDRLRFLIDQYCRHVQYQHPEPCDLYTLFRLIERLKDSKRGFLLDVPRETKE